MITSKLAEMTAQLLPTRIAGSDAAHFAGKIVQKTKKESCEGTLRLADSNRTIVDVIPSGIEHAHYQEQYRKSVEASAECMKQQLCREFKGTKTTAIIQEVLTAKKDLEKSMFKLESLEVKGMPVYDAQALKEMREGITILFAKAFVNCKAKYFLKSINPMIKALKKSLNGLVKMNNQWLAFKQGDHPVARYILESNGYTAEDLFAAKLMILTGAGDKAVETLFPKKAD